MARIWETSNQGLDLFASHCVTVIYANHRPHSSATLHHERAGMQTHVPTHSKQAEQQAKSAPQPAQFIGEQQGKFVDSRAEMAKVRQLRQLIDNSHQGAGGRALQAMMSNSAQAHKGRALQAIMSNGTSLHKGQATQRMGNPGTWGNATQLKDQISPKPNGTGLTNQLKAEIGVNDDVGLSALAPLCQRTPKGNSGGVLTLQMARTALPDPTRKDLRIEELDLVLDSESVFDQKLSENAGEAYRNYLNETDEDLLPPILRQAKAILKELEDGDRAVPESWADVPIAQIAAIIEHSMQGYLVNTELRKPNDDDSRYPNLLENFAQIGNTVLGLDRQIPYRGWVYRGQSVPISSDGEYSVGKTITFRGFTSTTKSALVSDQFKPTKDTEIGMMLTMLSVTGRDISEIAHDPTEQEVLFAPGTEFRVIERVNGGKVAEITLIESSAGDFNVSAPDRLKEIAKERQVKEESSKKIESSGPSTLEMLNALISASVDVPGNINEEQLKVLYNTRILKM